MAKWLTASEALSRLGVRPQTLYAYVSRGRLEARPDEEDPRKSLYRADDITRLQTRKARGRKAALVAEDTIAWGEPVLASAITTVSGGRLYYRGRDAIVLAETASLEQVAALLWEAREVRYAAPDGAMLRAKGIAPLHRAFAIVADRAATGGPMLGKSSALLRAEAAGLM